MKVAQPHISDDLQLVQDPLAQLQQDHALVEAIVESKDLSSVRFSGLNFSGVSLQKVITCGAILEKSDWIDVQAMQCDLTATNCAESSWRRVHMKGSRCSGFLFYTATCEDVTFENCKLDLANFRFTKFKNVRFVDCVLDKADFYQAELKTVSFENCTLNETEFSQAKLDKADFRTSDLMGIKGIESMKGAIISSTQLIYLAPLLVLQLGIIVED
jgi:uncharacterized protein YjbI with pentapeptide repeats